MIVIIDYGVGNTGSIKNMLKKVGVEAVVSYDTNIIKKASKLILPGVGSFDNAMKKLNTLDIIEVLTHKVLIEKVPFLGICLGMHLLAKNSEEGTLNGLGWINASVKKFNIPHLKVPHMGWNIPEIKKISPLILDLPSGSRFYFVHSYFVTCVDEEDILLEVLYGSTFVAAFEHDNIIGVQFHPEKSHKFGLQLLKNFIERY